jgi:hypothetical protein
MVAKQKTGEYNPMRDMWKMIPLFLVLLTIYAFVAYLVNLWIVTTGASIMGLTVTGDNVILSAAIMTVACILIFKKGKHMMMYKYAHHGM